MRILASNSNRSRAFTLAEVLVGVGVAMVLFVGLYAGISQAFAMTQSARENLRATQILQEKFETVRLYTWDQINTAGFIPPTFTAPFYSVNSNNTGGLIYTGQVTVTNAGLGGVSYENEMRAVIVNLSWQSGQVLHQRQMRTLVSRYGLQQYIY
jgi:Tfp pilus assembly protein PilV